MLKQPSKDNQSSKSRSGKRDLEPEEGADSTRRVKPRHASKPALQDVDAPQKLPTIEEETRNSPPPVNEVAQSNRHQTAISPANLQDNPVSVLQQTDEHTASDSDRRGFQSGDFVGEDDEDAEQLIQMEIELFKLQRKRKQANRIKHGGAAGAGPSRFPGSLHK
jgi:hypothetical protein